jgi:hypothetical protein
MMVVFMVIAALAIDLGVAYTARTTAQHSADAAALAGAYTLVSQQALTGSDLILAATKDAAAVANRYKVLNYPVTVSDAPQGPTACDTGTNMVCIDETKHRVTVTVGVPVDTYFAKLLPGVDLVHVNVMAVAEAAKNALGEKCLKPFYLSNDAITPLPLLDPKAATPQDWVNRCQKAISGTPEVNGGAPTSILDANGQLTQWAQDYIAQQKSFTKYTGDNSKCAGQIGCPISFWHQDTTGESQWGIIDFSEGQGNEGALVRCAITNCLQECTGTRAMYKCNDPVAELKTGQTTGNIEKAFQDEIGQIANKPANFYEDVGLYLNSGTEQKTSPSVVSVLIWDCTKAIDHNGTQAVVNVSGIGMLFINRVAKKNNSNAFLLGAGNCDNNNSEGPGGTTTVPIRLVYTGSR